MIPRAPFWFRLLAGIGIFFAIEGLLFRTGLYTRLLEPDSSAGRLQSILRNERQRTGGGAAQVLAIGDSRMGFRPRTANELDPPTGYRFASISMPGSTPRCWFYMLREVDPAASRYAAIVIGVDDYDDEDYEDIANRESDIRYLTPLLRWRDTVTFAASFPTAQRRWEAARAATLKGYALRADFQDLLVHHKFRMKRLADERANAASRMYREDWGGHSVAGLSVDYQARSIVYPPGATGEQKRLLEGVLLREAAPQTGQRGAYLREWYGRIVERYRGSRTRVVFLRLPRGPVVRPATPGKRSATVRDLAARGAAIALPEHAFDELERPEWFGDPLHLNQPGSEEFSRRAARELRRALGPAGE